ncbi:MAG: hypothetical protein H6645_08320 [Caldilineaceae bacterium]|nr:hypothetical protein [Caldilineaceae bacterium]MCB9157106.1 hypothetical protein [Caldilineaceae bacterium]
MPINELDIYEIRVAAKLDPAWSAWLGGLKIQNQENNTTVLNGALDVETLETVIRRIQDLGVAVVEWNERAPIIPTHE